LVSKTAERIGPRGAIGELHLSDLEVGDLHLSLGHAVEDVVEARADLELRTGLDRDGCGCLNVVASRGRKGRAIGIERPECHSKSGDSMISGVDDAVGDSDRCVAGQAVSFPELHGNVPEGGQRGGEKRARLNQGTEECGTGQTRTTSSE